jgi:hypothetical protein
MIDRQTLFSAMKPRGSKLKETESMRSRKEYMDKGCTHEEYYGQFVTLGIVALVRDRIGFERIGRSADAHFNDIPLMKWDAMQWEIGPMIESKLRSAGDALSLSSCVCVAKRAAAMLRLEYFKNGGAK